MRRAVIIDDGVVLGLHGARHLHVNVRTDALQADPDETSAGYGWKYVLLPLNDDLQELAQFINALTERYNHYVDEMNAEAERSVPLKSAKKLRSVKANAA